MFKHLAERDLQRWGLHVRVACLIGVWEQGLSRAGGYICTRHGLALLRQTTLLPSAVGSSLMPPGFTDNVHTSLHFDLRCLNCYPLVHFILTRRKRALSLTCSISLFVITYFMYCFLCFKTVINLTFKSSSIVNREFNETFVELFKCFAFKQ